LLLAAALALYVAPLPRAHSYLATNPQRIPRVAIYLDYENPLPNTAVQPFLEYVHSFVGRRRAELVLFSDAALFATGKRYRTLVKGGFRPVDVPHKRVIDVEGDNTNSKNSVDVELALYAYQQALLSPHPMDIVVVSGDQDYIPLIRRLWVEGHHVHVWAMIVPSAVAELAQQLNIEAATFSSLFSWQPSEPPGTQTGKAGKRPRQKSSTAGSAAETRSLKSGGALPTRATGNDAGQALGTPVSRARLVATFSSHRHVLDHVRQSYGTGKSALKVLGSQIGDKHRDVTEAFGFTGKGWTKRWLLLLQAIELFDLDSGGSMPLVGPRNADQAADRLLQFLHNLTECACALAATTTDRAITFVQLQSQLAAPSAPDADSAKLRHLLVHPSTEWPNPLAQLCRAASAVGLLRYEHPDLGAGIRVSEC
jgi:hypothetical protein